MTACNILTVAFIVTTLFAITTLLCHQMHGIAPKFGASKNQSQSVNKSVETTQQNCEIQTQSMDDIDFCSNFMFGNSIYFIAFLTEVINRTIMATKADEDVNI